MLAEIEHRGHIIKKNLDSRRAVRNSRRQRKTRYRPARFLNRTKPKGTILASLAFATCATFENLLIIPASVLQVLEK